MSGEDCGAGGAVWSAINGTGVADTEDCASKTDFDFGVGEVSAFIVEDDSAGSMG